MVNLRAIQPTPSKSPRDSISRLTFVLVQSSKFAFLGTASSLRIKAIELLDK